MQGGPAHGWATGHAGRAARRIADSRPGYAFRAGNAPGYARSEREFAPPKRINRLSQPVLTHLRIRPTTPAP